MATTKTTKTTAATTTFNFEILEHIGILDTSYGGWTTELNIVRFSRPDGTPGKAMHDLRAWNSDHSRCGKGLRLTDDGIKALAEILSKLD